MTSWCMQHKNVYFNKIRRGDSLRIQYDCHPLIIFCEMFVLCPSRTWQLEPTHDALPLSYPRSKPSQSALIGGWDSNPRLRFSKLPTLNGVELLT